MTSAYEIKNELAGELEIWVEPWSHPYRIPRGSVLTLSYDAATAEPLRTELVAERMVVWTNSTSAPAAALDGRPIAPDFD